MILAVPAWHEGWRAASAVLVALGTMVAGAMPGCRRDSKLEPPKIHYGEDPCIYCGMIISDERYAAASIVDIPGEGVVARLYDDTGDLVDYERENPAETVLKRYVHDLATKAWIDADTATYVLCPGLRTPMASGIGAFSTRGAAEAFISQNPGDIVDLATIRAHRAAQR